ncbi:MAG: 23S rRNA (guanosine(2251)-2'-O)-methyltransferase RlmB [Candidatus Marinimicrobia bacterium]|jgi:23S rRNA (guanosine2251-2'-O)-methyltransferase|nr:23S rRNA (guanosine(2251)-2'-O)-methyltransferase RlmB [Candidatus Neomarinimicrobiota bacterium]MDP6936861.1 23S rRNA (guanosine(2251)-2'-O)-methyltransferase RlmB [Candidatus Neomarinimicrobiota bacterium]
MRKHPAKKQQGIYQVYGINGTSNIIQTKKLTVMRIDIMQGGSAERKKWVQQLGEKIPLPVHRLPKDQFLKKYKGKRTQGIVVTFRGEVIRHMSSFTHSEQTDCLLALDSLEDPQNLGQIIRTAECANITGILLPEHQSVQVTDTVLQVSQGAFVHLPLYQCGNLHQQLRQLKKEGFLIIGVENSVDSRPWHSLDYQQKLVLVMGSEGKGIRPIIKKTCDELITIPMQGKLNSLNVSSATAVILFERLRQISS